MMNIQLIQIIQIYPSSTIPNRGTVHIQLPEIGIEIKNICYIKKENSLVALLPARYYRNEKSEKVYSTSIQFMKKEMQKYFMKELKKLLHEKITYQKVSDAIDPKTT